MIPYFAIVNKCLLEMNWNEIYFYIGGGEIYL